MSEGQATSDKRQLNSLVWAAQPQGSGPFFWQTSLFVARIAKGWCCAMCLLTHFWKLGINALTKTLTGKSTSHPPLVRESDGRRCESDPVAEMEWSPESHGPNRSRVA